MGRLYYTLVPKKNPINKEVKYYAVVKNYTPVSKTQVIELAEKNSNINRTVLEAVWKAWQRAMANYFTRGHNVQLWPLGSFYGVLKSSGALSADEFSASHIKSYKMAFVASPQLKRAALKANMSFLRYTPEPKDGGEEDGTA